MGNLFVVFLSRVLQKYGLLEITFCLVCGLKMMGCSRIFFRMSLDSKFVIG